MKFSKYAAKLVSRRRQRKFCRGSNLFIFSPAFSFYGLKVEE